MSDSLLTIDFDLSALFLAVERVSKSVEVRLKRESLTTANRIVLEAKRRLSGQLSGKSSGKTLAGIVVEESNDGSGYVVASRRKPYPALPRWIDKGTVNMPLREFFDVAAQLEEGPHRRRVAETLQDAIDHEGLGE